MRRYFPALVLAVLAAAVLAAAAIWRFAPPASPEGEAAIGGPFHLVDQYGAPRDQSLLKGKWSAVFFGYTFCPDACPTTLVTLAQAGEKLGADRSRFQVVFISLDPRRDTPAQMKRYLASPAFPKGAIGLTGDAAHVAEAARRYRVYYRTVGTGETYSLDHTAIVYLMDPRGRFRSPVGYGQSPAQVAGQIAEAMRQG